MTVVLEEAVAIKSFLQGLPGVLGSAARARRLAAFAQLKGFKRADTVNMVHMCAAQPGHTL